MGVRVWVNSDTVYIDNGQNKANTISVSNFSFIPDQVSTTVTIFNNGSYFIRILTSDVLKQNGTPYGTFTTVVEFLSSINAQAKGVRVDEINALPPNAASESTLLDFFNWFKSIFQSLGQKISAESVPVVLSTEQELIMSDGITRAVRIDEKTTPKTVYLGYAEIASSEASAVWRIKKIDTSTGADTTWADGDSDFDNVWNDRAILTYL
jgi:hypothetical protein